jgi:hypothetical protein
MNVLLLQPRFGLRGLGVFALAQVAVMLLAISNESLWIDEFWTAHFAAMHSFKAFRELLMVPSGSQTPLHFLHFYLWGLFVPAGEYLLRLANLPLFVAGQLAVFWALRDSPKLFSALFLGLSALHPMVWQYANEARPYSMMLAGSQMMLAYLLHLHTRSERDPATHTGFFSLFVLGGILLFGASLLGAFWVLAASLFVLIHHVRKRSWRELTRGVNLLLLGLFFIATALLTVYYLKSLLAGGGASRLATSTASTALFAAYEILGLSGIGPGRLELRALGLSALAPYALALLAAGAVLVTVLATGLKQANNQMGSRRLLLVVALGLFPVAVVLLSGFVMHWRVLGRHMIAALPMLNLVLAWGLASLLQAGPHRGRWARRMLAISAVLFLVYSSVTLRFAPQHRKDDYRAAAAIAKTAIAQGQRVWWAADVIGADYYGLPGEFDVMGELTSIHKPQNCGDATGVLAIANASTQCLNRLPRPDVVILSKPETFDIKQHITAYLNAHQFAATQSLPAFTIWRRSTQSGSDKP